LLGILSLDRFTLINEFPLELSQTDIAGLYQDEEVSVMHWNLINQQLKYSKLSWTPLN